MGRGDFAVTAAASTKGTPRVRNKITHKTRLRIIHGDIQDSDRIFVDDDSADGKNLATGVDAEDANVSLFFSSIPSTTKTTRQCHVTPSDWLLQTTQPQPPIDC